MTNPESIRHILLQPEDNQRLSTLCGQFDENLHLIERYLGVEISNRGNDFEVMGIPRSIAKACDVLETLYATTATEKDLSSRQVQLVLRSTDSESDLSTPAVQEKLKDASLHLHSFTIQPRTRNQLHYLDMIHQHDINFGIGPSGTGKTYLAAASALAALEREEVTRIILVRPAVEAGESLGFLPGNLSEKVDPYLRPLYDALFEMLGTEKVTKLIEQGTIEIAPLAYMRGRTLSEAFIILDEAQNATREQIRMFLTRIGLGSKAVITGDITQVDLVKKENSGLRHAISLLRDIQDIQFTFFTAVDVVRHPLVQQIIEAFERDEG